MNEEIHCITNEKKANKNEWENDDSDFLRALHILNFTCHSLLRDLPSIDFSSDIILCFVIDP